MSKPKNIPMKNRQSVQKAEYVEANNSMAKFLMSRRPRRLAQRVGQVVAAKAAANMAASGVETGEAASSYRVEIKPWRPLSPRGDLLTRSWRWTAAITNDAPGAVAFELGTETTPETRPLRNAAEPYHVPRRRSHW